MSYTAGESDEMANSWMAAAGQGAIPTAFLVKNGVIVWIGSPSGLDAPLADLKTGGLDVKKVRADFEKKAAKVSSGRAVGQAINEAESLFDAGQRTEAKAALARVLSAHPEAAGSVETTRFAWLATEDPQAWEEAAKRKASAGAAEAAKATPETLPYEWMSLGSFAIVRAQKAGGADLARRAVEILTASAKRDDYRTLSYAKSVYTMTKDWAKALAATEGLLAACDRSPTKGDPMYKSRLQADRADLRAKLGAK